MAVTIVAYVYDLQSGLLDRRTISDNFKDGAALIERCCAPGQSAIIVKTFDGDIKSNIDNISLHSDDDAQAMIEQETGIVPPAKLKYAYVDPADRLVFDVVETRRVNDYRLTMKFQDKEHYELVQKAEADPGDTILPDGTLVKKPPPPPDAEMEVL